MNSSVEEIEVGTMEETKTVPKILRISISRDVQKDPSPYKDGLRCYRAEVYLAHINQFDLSMWSDDIGKVRSAVDVLLRHLLAPEHGFKPIE